MRSSLKKSLEQEARALARELIKNEMRIVFAESCTGGLIAATLAQIPGISESLCGSAVVYREATKNQWLGVPSRSLEKLGAVSREVSIEMAKGVLKKTPEAQISASITGFLGPSGPKQEMGHAFASIAIRGSKQVITQELWIMHRARLTHNIRTKRQRLASHTVLNMVRSLLMSVSQQKRTLKSG